MKTLLLLRHAKSSWKDSSLADHARPLNRRGQKAAPLMGRLIRARSLLPELIVSSTATRTRETTRLVTEASGYDGPVEFESELYLAEPETLMSVAGRTKDADKLMLVGHNPGLEDLIESLTGQHERFPTGALAVIELELDAWQELGPRRGRLAALYRPRELAA